ncbi:YetF domain-containing protein [Baekduia alba]
MRRQRIPDDELASEARQQSIGSLRQVRFAVLESSGKVSFVTR